MKTLLSGAAFESQYGTFLFSFSFFFFLFFFFIFFSFDVYFILYYFFIRKSSPVLLNQTDEAVDETLENVIITIDSRPETDIGYYESGYEYSSGETVETSSETAWTSNAYCS